MLQPAIVTKVGDTSAEVYIRGIGPAQINWVGLSWARRLTKSGGLMANPRKAADVVAVGDVVYVVTDRRGYAQLAQMPVAQGALVAMDPDDGAIVSMVGGFDYYSNKFNRATQAKRQHGGISRKQPVFRFIIIIIPIIARFGSAPSIDDRPAGFL